MKLFAQIRKVDEAKRLVYGRAAEEVVDKADEIMDYESSKPHFMKWSEDIAKDTDGKSLGNLRAMHGKVAAGKLTGIDFNDAEKAIDVCAKVVDDNEWKKVLEGVYTGFSIGGAYVGDKKVEKADGRDVSRYTAKPNEVSLVDRPCMPTAKFFEVQKADGTLAKVDFQAAPAESDAGTINGTPEQVDALVKMMNEGGLTLAEVIEKALPDFIADKKKKKDGDGKEGKADEKEPKDDKPADKAATAGDLQKVDGAVLRKNFYTCGELANLLSSLQCLQSNMAWHAYYDGAVSPIPKRIAAAIALIGGILKDMIDEEIAELGEGASLELSEKAAGLAKFEGDADPLLTLVKIGARNSAADASRLAKIHEMTVELGHECATKAAPAGDLTKADTGALEKMVADAVAPLQKALTEASEKITKLEAQPAPARVALRAIAKGEDLTGADPVQKVAEPIVDDHGDKHEVAGLIKSIHQSGGARLTVPLTK